MKHQPFIRSIIALLLLVVALLGSTPKKFLHDALAGHKDVSYGFKGCGTAVNATSFQCGFDHQVAESPFTEADAVQLPQLQIKYHIPLSYFFYTDPAAGFSASTNGRGPPSGQPQRC